MPRRWNFWLLAAMLAVNVWAPRRAWAQTISVPLGTAASFGLLSGSTLSTDSATTVRVEGRAGAATAIDGPIQANGGLYRPGSGAATVTTALTDLAAARAYCSSLSSAPLTSLNGQTLTGGAYTLTGNATLNAGAPLTLDGPASAVFVINVTGNLMLAPGAVVQLGAQTAIGNVYWNISGTLTADQSSGLPGYVLTGGAATLTNGWPTMSAVLSGGALTLQQLATGPAEDEPTFFAAPAAIVVPGCPSVTAPGPNTCANLVFNSGFEWANPAVDDNAVPNQASNVCNQPSPLSAANQLAGWRSATWTTPDWFRRNAPNAGVSVPNNIHNPVSSGLLVDSRTSGRAYAGIWAAYAEDQNDRAEHDQFREYLHQQLATPVVPGKHYYAEFSSNAAPDNNRTVGQLGLAVHLGSFDRQREGLLTGVVPVATANDRAQPNPSFRTLGAWTRTAGGFRATQAGDQVIIGNFRSFANSELQLTPGAFSTGPRRAYYYLDDVVLQAFPEQIIATSQTCSYRLTVDCPLPTSSGAVYEWYNAAGTLVYTGLPFSFAQPNTTYTVRIHVVVPDGSTYPATPATYVVLGPLTTGCGLDICDGITLDVSAPGVPTNYQWNPTNPWNPANPFTTTPRTVRGTVRVKAGVTLTIDAVRIQFDDTRAYQPAGEPAGDQPINPTRIIVERGGHLVVRNSAWLTRLNECPNRYAWDGIAVYGNPALVQGNPEQGIVEINSNAKIEWAYFGVLANDMPYNSVRVPKAPQTTALSGGLVRATQANFLNCAIGVHMFIYNHGIKGNLSGITGSTFLRDTDWTAYTYSQSNITTLRCDVTHVYLNGVRRLLIQGNTFAISDALANQYSQNRIPRGDGVYLVGSNVQIAGEPNTLPGTLEGPNSFLNLGTGIYGSGGQDVALTITNNRFRHCYFGMRLTGYISPLVTNNDFRVGHPSDTYATGALLTTCSGFQIEGNTFQTGAPQTPSLGFALGLKLQASDGALQYSGLTHKVYRNYFAYLGEGIRTLGSNQNLLLQCNHFATTAATDPANPGNVTPGNAPGSIAGNDIALQQGASSLALQNPQGQCISGNPAAAANNVFSHGSKVSILVVGPSVGTPQQAFTYNFIDDNSRGATPGTYPFSAGRNLQTSSLGMTVTACLSGTFNYNTACPPQLQRPQSDTEMLAAIQTATDPVEQAELVSELVRHYLNDTTYYETGIDSAIALMEAVNAPKYAELIDALAFSVRDEADASGARAAPASPALASRGALRQAKGAVPAIAIAPAGGTADRRGGTYFAQVRAFLRPLGSDSAIAAVLAADSALRTPLWRIANDTLRWDHIAGRAALSYYCGYRFRPLHEPADTTGYHRAAPAPVTVAPAAPTLRLFPNPTSGAVQVAFTQPDGEAGRLVLYDAYGQPVRELRLKGATGTTLLDTRGLRPGVYYYTQWAGAVKGERGTLLVQP